MAKHPLFCAYANEKLWLPAVVLRKVIARAQTILWTVVCHMASMKKTLKKASMMHWMNAMQITSKKYQCGFCSNVVASSLGYFSGQNQYIYICTHCFGPTYWGNDAPQFPGLLPGSAVANLPESIEALYNEARQCAAAGAFTGAVLLCRKLLMNIGVAQGAPEGEHFISYVNYLANAGFIPPNGRGWVDHIRRKGNEATHEIALMSEGDAVDLISFAEMLMKFIYEFPSRIPSPSPG